MDSSATSLTVQWLVSGLQVLLILGVCWWFTRGDRKVFSIWRVFGVALLAAFVSFGIVALWWWRAPQQVDRHSPLLLTAAFLPIFALLAWGVLLGMRQKSAKNNGTPMT